jgi:hypothetical protein
MKTGIYIVETTGPNGTVRSLVLARSAQEAGEPFAAAETTVEVGRLGTYDPGISGAAMTYGAAMGEALIAELVDEDGDES